MKVFLLALWEVLEVVLVAVITVFLIRSFLVQPFLVSGASMEPNFSNGNYLLVDEVTYHFRAPERGEVIVFEYPGNPSIYYIKRIVGLPGETVKIHNGQVRIAQNPSDPGTVLSEDYLPPGVMTSGDITETLGPTEYFMMGDNRNYSFDSRSWGPMDQKYIIGIVRLRLLPLSDIKAFTD
ncbi:MAG: signal peptidase I [Patescibacteria group bacterium]|nr:signal peptidase I [Patescibacteria group bacterium]